MLEVPLPSAPCVVEAIIAICHVVIESASGIAMLAMPSLSVMISGLMYNASGKYERTRGAAAPSSSFSFTSVAVFLVITATSAPVTTTVSFMAGIALGAAGGIAMARASNSRRNGALPAPPATPPMTPPATPPPIPNPTLKSATIFPVSLTATTVPECSCRSKTERIARSRGSSSSLLETLPESEEILIW